MRLSRGHIRWVYWSCALLFSTGALWLVFHYFLQLHGEYGDRPHPLEIWCLRLHGGAAMLVLIVLGSLLPIHIRRGWHQRKNIPAGVTLTTIALVLIASGYALYYFGGEEEARAMISIAHWTIGLTTPLVIVWHIWAGRAQRSREARSAHARSPTARSSTASTQAGRDPV